MTREEKVQKIIEILYLSDVWTKDIAKEHAEQILSAISEDSENEVTFVAVDCIDCSGCAFTQSSPLCNKMKCGDNKREDRRNVIWKLKETA